MKRYIVLLMTILIYIGISPLYADKIYLKTGRIVEGKIIEEKKGTVTIEEIFGNCRFTTAYRAIEIDRVEKSSEEENKKMIKESDEKRKEAERIATEERRKQEKIQAGQKKVSAKAGKMFQSEIEQSKRRTEELQRKIEALNKKQEKEERERKKKKREREKENRAFRFGEISQYVDVLGYVHYQGLVYNKGTRTKRFVKIKMIFYDSRKKMLKTESGYTDPSHIPAGRKATFDISRKAWFPVKTYETTATWSY